MADRTEQRPTIDPDDGFTYTAVAKPGAFERLGEELDRLNQGWAERNAREKH